MLFPGQEITLSSFNLAVQGIRAVHKLQHLFWGWSRPLPHDTHYTLGRPSLLPPPPPTFIVVISFKTPRKKV